MTHLPRNDFRRIEPRDIATGEAVTIAEDPELSTRAALARWMISP